MQVICPKSNCIKFRDCGVSQIGKRQGFFLPECWLPIFSRKLDLLADQYLFVQLKWSSIFWCGKNSVQYPKIISHSDKLVWISSQFFGWIRIISHYAKQKIPPFVLKTKIDKRQLFLEYVTKNSPINKSTPPKSKGGKVEWIRYSCRRILQILS